MQARRIAPLPTLLRLALGLTLASTPAWGQAFVSATGKIPGGAPLNSSFTENVDFADPDLDGDFDAVFANGGECCNDQNRLWLNQGGLQGGTPGFFADATAARLPAVSDNSRDIEFVDFDADGDADLFVTNTSQLSNQTSRFWVNQGGLQSGTAGFFSDDTAARFVNVGVNDGLTTFSSVAPSLVLGAGGFIDWTCDGGFADLDSDGDLDLVQATYGLLGSGKVPMRLFLNDGTGHFEEFNPSGVQLGTSDILDGTPGLWAEGLQVQNTPDASGAECDIANKSISVELADLDGDLDLDILAGSLDAFPRVYQNRREENGGVFTRFRDRTSATWPVTFTLAGRKYEQELGDLDGDDDLDLFGTNWAQPCDLVLRNQGDGSFVSPVTLASSCVLNNEPDYIDFDSDGDLDVIVASEDGQEQIYVNQGHAGGGQLVLDMGLLPVDVSNSLGVDAVDLDGDGDYDAMIANDKNTANVLLENILQVADKTAPRLARLEQAPDRVAGPVPTAVRVQLYDNQAEYLTAFDNVRIEVSVSGSPVFTRPMRWSGGQVLRGEIPGALAGTIAYRVLATDRQGNTSISVQKTFQSSSSCAPTPTVYCTSQTSSAGCTPTIGSGGFPSASAGAGYFIWALQVTAGNPGLLFYSKSGTNNVPLLGGTLCVLPPNIRTPTQFAKGLGACGGFLRIDFNAWIATGFDPALQPGQDVWAQYWWRDPGAASGSNLTDGLHFTLCD